MDLPPQNDRPSSRLLREMSTMASSICGTVKLRRHQRDKDLQGIGSI